MTFAGRIRHLLHRDEPPPARPSIDVDAFIAERKPHLDKLEPGEVDRMEAAALQSVDRDEVIREAEAAAKRWRQELRNSARRSP